MGSSWQWFCSQTVLLRTNRAIQLVCLLDELTHSELPFSLTVWQVVSGLTLIIGLFSGGQSLTSLLTQTLSTLIQCICHLAQKLLFNWPHQALMIKISQKNGLRKDWQKWLLHMSVFFWFLLWRCLMTLQYTTKKVGKMFVDLVAGNVKN